MADANMQNFHNRMRDINRKHAKLSRGYVTSVNHDGLIIAKPRARGGRFPWRGLLFSLVIIMAFKILLFSQLGTAAYAERVASLKAGSTLEQVGAFVLEPDPITIYLGAFIPQAVPD